MTVITSENMIDNIEVALRFFRVVKPDNFYGRKGIVPPKIDTLKDFSCYATIPTDKNYHAYWLKSQIKTTLGYRPSKVVIQDIPFVAGKRFCLVINVSLPKILFASNIFEINEEQWREVIDAIYNELLHFGVEISKKELEETQPRRIDYCKNVIIETPVVDFIASLQKLKKIRAKTFVGYDETIYFNTRKKKTCIYDKILEVINKASPNQNDKTYKLAQELKTLQAFSNIHVIRVEQRLFGLPAIRQEVQSIIKSKDITLKSLFNKNVASHVLYKHWTKIATEERFKTLLLGEKEVNVILGGLAKIAEQQQLKNVNPIFVLYSKLLAEIGEGATNNAIKGMRKPRTLVNNKKELYALVKLLPLYDKRLNDYRNITAAVSNWDSFSLPITIN